MSVNKELHKAGYSWKRTKVRCVNTLKCGWEGRRIWRRKMFSKPCPKCGCSLFCHVAAVKEVKTSG